MEQTDTNRTPSFLRFERTPAGTGQPHVHGIYYMHPANHSTLPSRGGNALRSGFTSEPDAWATICYGELKHSMSNEDHAGARSLGDLTFADSKCALPLQAADLLAYEAYKYAIWA